MPSVSGQNCYDGWWLNLLPGLATQTVQDGEAVKIGAGGPLAVSITGGVIYNPLEAVDQGLVAAESLFVDFTGPAYSYATETTIELESQEKIEMMKSTANCTTGAWV